MLQQLQPMYQMTIRYFPFMFSLQSTFSIQSVHSTTIFASCASLFSNLHVWIFLFLISSHLDRLLHVCASCCSLSPLPLCLGRGSGRKSMHPRWMCTKIVWEILSTPFKVLFNFPIDLLLCCPQAGQSSSSMGRRCSNAVWQQLERPPCLACGKIYLFKVAGKYFLHKVLNERSEWRT